MLIREVDLLDPGLSKRPSRFDRKYLFPMPSLADRTQYAQYWRNKLSSNPKIDFPEQVCPAIAGITDDFSFAYMKEAFVATLLMMAVGKRDGEGVEKIVREEKGEEKGESVEKSDSTVKSENEVQVESAENGESEEKVETAEKGETEEKDESPEKLDNPVNGETVPKAIPEGAVAEDVQGQAEGAGGGPDGLEGIPLWKEFQKQVRILREEMGTDGSGAAASDNSSGLGNGECGMMGPRRTVQVRMARAGGGGFCT
jgi:hypothetical protein